MKRYTTAEAAAVLGAAISTVTKHARKLGIIRLSRDYLFAAADLTALRRSMSESKPGRPRITQRS